MLFVPEPTSRPAAIFDGPGAVNQKTPEDHKSHLQPKVFNGAAESDLKMYSIVMVDANKNRIPTGTELFVQGRMYTTRWGPTDDCTWLLAGRPLPVQHGEVDPTLYCRFSIILTDKLEDGRDGWPGIGLVCDVTPQKMKEITHGYHYGDAVQVHGSYAASLDFAVASLPGGHFGVPVLKGCTFADPPDKVVSPERPTNETNEAHNPSLARAPRLISSAEPKYPDAARATKISGTRYIHSR